MTLYTFAVACHRCGGDTRHVNGTSGTNAHQAAVCECVDCGRQCPDKSKEGYLGAKGLPYSSMSLAEIMALPVGDLAADDARLYLWITNKYLRHAWAICEAWGFEPQERTLVWCKTPRGTTPVTTEFVTIGKRGNPPRMPWHGSTWFNWPHQSHHSQKPAAMYDLVEQWSPGPYIELFARAPRLGWDSWGKGYELGGGA